MLFWFCSEAIPGVECKALSSFRVTEKGKDIVEVELKYCWLKETVGGAALVDGLPPESFRAQQRPFGTVNPRQYLNVCA